MFKQQNEVDCGIFVLLGVEQLHQQMLMPEEESMEAELVLQYCTSSYPKDLECVYICMHMCVDE